jgi:hypothetical protein
MNQACRSFLLAAAVASASAANTAAAEITPGASGVTASTQDTNVPGNAVDNNLGTRWSGNGDGAWIRFDVGSVQTIAYVTIAVYNGNSRQNLFDLDLSTDGATWTRVLTGKSTSGTTTAEEVYDFTDTPARYVRYTGHGSTAGSWNSLSEVSIFGAAPVATPTPTPAATVTPAPRPTPTPIVTATPTPVATATPVSYTEITPAASAVTASTNDGNVPGNTVDNTLSTRWSGSGDGAWLQFDLGAVKTVGYVKVAAYNGNTRQNIFDLQVSSGSGVWTTVFSGRSGGTTTQEETYDFPDVSARYVRYLGHMNTVNAFNSVTEVSVFGSACTACPTPTPAPRATPTPTPGGNYTAAQVLAGIQSHMTSSVQVNTKAHINTMTRTANVNVYQVTPGVFAYASGMAIDTDGSDPDPDPDHQGTTTWKDSNGAYLGSHHVPYYVLGDYCYDNVSPCPHFFYGEHNITGRQFALIFYNGKCIGAVFGDTQGDSVTPTSDNDSRELGEASVESAILLGIPSSGTTGGVDNGVTVVIFSGSQWVINGTNSTLNSNAQAKVQQALNLLGSNFGL